MEKEQLIKRKSGFWGNSYQRQVVFLALAPSFILCAVITAFIIIFYESLMKMLIYSTAVVNVNEAKIYCNYALIGVWLFFILTAIWVTASSKHIVGAFTRIIKALDVLIYGKERKFIHARERDALANALLERVNILIKHLPGSGWEDPTIKTIGRF